jgi:hypothetical protein
MPHLIANRPRFYDLTRAPAVRGQLLWESINAVTYKVGGVIFLVGSVLFFPAFSRWADLGAWLFVLGSLLYLAVNIHDAVEIIHHRRQMRRHPETIGQKLSAAKLKLESLATAAYLSGSVLFIVGSLFFLSKIDWIHAGAWCFIIGSLLFVVGALVNVLEIFEAQTFVTMQLMNLTAITFVVGSALFAVASVPYLWSFEAAADKRQVLNYLAAQFVLGSALFLVGGIINYLRACLVIRSQLLQNDRS